MFWPLCMMAALSLLCASCSQTSDENLIKEFVSNVNRDGGDVKAKIDGDNVILTCQLEKTPENIEKIVLLNNDESCQKAFKNAAKKSLNEGKLLARFVKEKKSLIYIVKVDDDTWYGYMFSPQEIKQFAFGK